MRSRIPILLIVLSLLCASFLQISAGRIRLNEQQAAGDQPQQGNQQQKPVDGQQPGGQQTQAAGQQQPGDQPQQPGGQQQQPGQQEQPGQQQPGSQQQQPGGQNQQPGQQDQPGSQQQQPGGQQQPGDQQQQPGDEQQQPGGQQQQPGDQQQQPRSQQPGDQQQQQPGGQQQQPGDQQANNQQVGVCYGTFADNQPSAKDAVSVVQLKGIKRMRLYGSDHNALQSLRNTGIEVVLGLPNEQLQEVAYSFEKTHQWFLDNVGNYPDVNFRYIVVGNGITPVHDQTSQFAQYVIQAMQNIQDAISRYGLQDQMKVTTAIDQSKILSQSFPPSQGQFRAEVRQFIDPIIKFLVNNNNAPLLVNLHPYHSYVHNKQDIPQQLQSQGGSSQDARLEYATLRSQNTIVQDGPLSYTNVFDAMVDSVHSALEKAGGSSLDVVVSETGWPTAGGDAASYENASNHNNNLIKHVRNYGTPKRPQKRIEAYIFNLFDENRRDGEEFEKNWGIFWNDKRAKYRLDFQCQ